MSYVHGVSRSRFVFCLGFDASKFAFFRFAVFDHNFSLRTLRRAVRRLSSPRHSSDRVWPSARVIRFGGFSLERARRDASEEGGATGQDRRAQGSAGWWEARIQRACENADSVE